LQQLVQEEREHQHAIMQRIHWLVPGTAWSIDATHYQGRTLVPLVDLVSRYRFNPLVSLRQDGLEIAAFLDATFPSTRPAAFPQARQRLTAQLRTGERHSGRAQSNAP
jgi:hypothetical protein